MSEDGKKCQFAEPNWTTSQNFQMKITALMFSKAKAILFVPDPKSGFKSFSESSPGIAGYLSSSVNGTKVNPGADDDASGCAALLSTAEAFKKLELVTRTVYEIGFTVANKKTRLVVDNPFSSWGKSK